MSSLWIPFMFSVLHTQASYYLQYVPPNALCEIEEARKIIVNEEDLYVIEAKLTHPGGPLTAATFVLPEKAPSCYISAYRTEYCSVYGRGWYNVSKLEHLYQVYDTLEASSYIMPPTTYNPSPEGLAPTHTPLEVTAGYPVTSLDETTTLTCYPPTGEPIELTTTVPLTNEWAQTCDKQKEDATVRIRTNSPPETDSSDEEDDENLGEPGNATPESPISAITSGMEIDLGETLWKWNTAIPPRPDTACGFYDDDDSEDTCSGSDAELEAPPAYLDLAILQSRFGHFVDENEDCQRRSHLISKILSLDLDISETRNSEYEQYMAQLSINDQSDFVTFCKHMLGYPVDPEIEIPGACCDEKHNSGGMEDYESGISIPRNMSSETQLPNLKQYTPKGKEREDAIQAQLNQLPERERTWKRRIQWAEGRVDWHYMSQWSQRLLETGPSRRARRLEEADRSVDWFWDGQSADIRKEALSLEQLKNARSAQAENVQPDWQHVHHLSFNGRPVYDKSETVPAISCWLAWSPGLSERINTDGRLYRTVESSEAAKWTDPFFYDGDEYPPEELTGDALKNWVTGSVYKVYEEYGTWNPEDYGPDDDKPLSVRSVPEYADSRRSEVNYVPGPYDSEQKPPSKGMKPAMGKRSNLCFVKNGEDIDKEAALEILTWFSDFQLKISEEFDFEELAWFSEFHTMISECKNSNEAEQDTGTLPEEESMVGVISGLHSSGEPVTLASPPFSKRRDEDSGAVTDQSHSSENLKIPIRENTHPTIIVATPKAETNAEVQNLGTVGLHTMKPRRSHNEAEAESPRPEGILESFGGLESSHRFEPSQKLRIPGNRAQKEPEGAEDTVGLTSLVSCADSIDLRLDTTKLVSGTPTKADEPGKLGESKLIRAAAPQEKYQITKELRATSYLSGLLEMLPERKFSTCLLYGSIAVYLGHRAYTALRR